MEFVILKLAICIHEVCRTIYVYQGNILNTSYLETLTYDYGFRKVNK